MLQATFKISLSELTPDIISKIKSLFQNGSSEEAEVVIFVKPKESVVFPQENREQYFARLEKAMRDFDQETNLVTFTPEELEAFVGKLKEDSHAEHTI